MGSELRRLRLASGLAGEQVARTLDWSQAKISRIETGRTAFTVRDVAGLLGHSTVRAAMIYQHANSERDHEVARSIDARLRQQRAKQTATAETPDGEWHVDGTAPG